MKGKRISEKRIISILKEREAGMKVAEPGTQAWGIEADDLPLAEQVRRRRSLRGEAAEVAGRGEPAAEADGGGFEPGQADARRRHQDVKKPVTSTSRASSCRPITPEASSPVCRRSSAGSYSHWDTPACGARSMATVVRAACLFPCSGNPYAAGVFQRAVLAANCDGGVDVVPGCGHAGRLWHLHSETCARDTASSYSPCMRHE